MFVDVKRVGKFGSQNPPLVIAEIIEHHKKHFFAGINGGKNGSLEYFSTNQRARIILSPRSQGLHPLHIVVAYIFGKAVVSLLFLHGKHL